jgi:hypothetical protein
MPKSCTLVLSVSWMRLRAIDAAQCLVSTLNIHPRIRTRKIVASQGLDTFSYVKSHVYAHVIQSVRRFGCRSLRDMAR